MGHKTGRASDLEAVVGSENASSAVTAIVMPQAGQSMEEGTIIAWHAKVGDRIELGQVIMEIETDKATMEVEATEAGRLARIVAGVGATVEVKQPVAWLAESEEELDAWLTGGAGAEAVAPVATPVAPEPNLAAVGAPAFVAVSGACAPLRVAASPAARRLARNLGVDLNTFASGTGPRGRILLSDVEAAAKAGAETGAGAAAATVRPASRMRRAIATNLQRSKQTIPHFYLKAEIDAGALWTAYREARGRFLCSVNDFVTAACARALREFPALRGRWQDDGIAEQAGVHIGIAVGTDDGLTVPVVLDADRLGLEALAQRSREVAEGARAGRLTGLGQGVFTITNLGMFGTDEFIAIVNPPEAAILAVGAVREGVIVKDGALRAGRLMTLWLSADHRLVDGVMAARFMARVRELLESPAELMS